MVTAMVGSGRRLGLPRALATMNGGVHGQGYSGSEILVGGACELHGASTAMVCVLKEHLVLLVAPATVVGQSGGDGAPTRCGAATQGSDGLLPRLR